MVSPVRLYRTVSFLFIDAALTKKMMNRNPNGHKPPVVIISQVTVTCHSLTTTGYRGSANCKAREAALACRMDLAHQSVFGGSHSWIEKIHNRAPVVLLNQKHKKKGPYACGMWVYVNVARSASTTSERWLLLGTAAAAAIAFG